MCGRTTREEIAGVFIRDLGVIEMENTVGWISACGCQFPSRVNSAAEGVMFGINCRFWNLESSD